MVNAVHSIGDHVTRIGDLKTAIDAFNTERNWRRFFSPKNLAMSIAIEAAELMELFQWVDNEAAAVQAAAGPHRDQMAEELADVLIYCLTLASVMDLDVSTIVTQKIAANGRKYPPDHSDPLDRYPPRTTPAEQSL